MSAGRRHRGHDRSLSRVRSADVRASDAEREKVVAKLQAHTGEGRLTLDELAERIERAYEAQTRSELARLTRDLPRLKRDKAERARREFREHLRLYLLVMVMLVAIWALTGTGYFWPVWPALGWGIGVASHGLSVRRRPRRKAITTG